MLWIFSTLSDLLSVVLGLRAWILSHTNTHTSLHFHTDVEMRKQMTLLRLGAQLLLYFAKL
jgi:hypothetical protein